MRYSRVIMEKKWGRNRTLAIPDCRTHNFRIVSHHGRHDWSPYVSLAEALKRWELLPEREDGFFLLVEG